MSTVTPPPAQERRLRARIGWICHVVRVSAVAYALWLAAALVSFWLDDAAIRGIYGPPPGVMESAVSSMQRLSGMLVSGIVWLIVCLACMSAWRLFSTYLKGCVFSVEAAVWLKRLGSLGLLALAADIVARVLLTFILSATAPTITGSKGVLFPIDLLFALIFLSVIAFAHVFRAAADIAEENAAFV